MKGMAPENEVRRRRVRRGVASIEALMGISTLIVLWAGTKFIVLGYVAAITTKQEARSCAWQIAARSCEDVPPECQGKVTEDGEVPEKIDRVTDASDVSSHEEELLDEAEPAVLLDKDENEKEVGGEPQMPRVQKKVDGAIEGVFRKSATSQSGREIAQPSFMGSESISVSRSYTLPCNTNPQHDIDGQDGLLINLFKGFTGG